LAGSLEVIVFDWELVGGTVALIGRKFLDCCFAIT